jgi:biotin transporter BioY
MKFFIVCALMIASALAAPQNPTTPVPIVHQELEVHHDGSFINK